MTWVFQRFIYSRVWPPLPKTSFSRLKSDAQHFWHLVPQDMKTYHKTQGYPNHSIASQVHIDTIDHIHHKSNM